jgi:hypothetical protein
LREKSSTLGGARPTLVGGASGITRGPGAHQDFFAWIFGEEKFSEQKIETKKFSIQI